MVHEILRNMPDVVRIRRDSICIENTDEERQGEEETPGGDGATVCQHLGKRGSLPLFFRSLEDVGVKRPKVFPRFARHSP